MKKIFVFPMLALAAIGGWAFYPKPAASDSGYMMVVGSGRPGTSNWAEVTTISPTGRRQVQPLTDIRVSSEGPSVAGAVAVHAAELLAVNKLYAQGWSLVNVAQSTVGAGAATETVYVLEKR